MTAAKQVNFFSSFSKQLLFWKYSSIQFWWLLKLWNKHVEFFLFYQKHVFFFLKFTFLRIICIFLSMNSKFVTSNIFFNITFDTEFFFHKENRVLFNDPNLELRFLRFRNDLLQFPFQQMFFSFKFDSACKSLNLDSNSILGLYRLSIKLNFMEKNSWSETEWKTNSKANR